MVWIAVLSLVVSIATMAVVWVRLGARGVVLLGKDGDGGAEAVPLPTPSPVEGLRKQRSTRDRRTGGTAAVPQFTRHIKKGKGEKHESDEGRD